MSGPKAFVSYSWDDDDHKRWTKEFATRLRNDGVDATLDQWATVPGTRLPLFMEQAIRENDYVLIVCTPNYKAKSDGRKGGVGYEGDIMTGEIFAKGNHEKYIPILRRGNWATALPSWLKGKYGIDLTADPFSEEQYRDILATLHNMREPAPPLGPSPRLAPRPYATSVRSAARKILPPEDDTGADFEPIKIEGIIADEVGEPRNDGTPGCALYTIPFKLSRAPSNEWAECFKRTWDRPPRWTNWHRPGIARVQRDRIILAGTTIEEVQRAHRDTLKLVVQTVNAEMTELLRQRKAAEQAKTKQRDEHRDSVRRLAGDINFD